MLYKGVRASTIDTALVVMDTVCTMDSSDSSLVVTHLLAEGFTEDEKEPTLSGRSTLSEIYIQTAYVITSFSQNKSNM